MPNVFLCIVGGLGGFFREEMAQRECQSGRCRWSTMVARWGENPFFWSGNQTESLLDAILRASNGIGGPMGHSGAELSANNKLNRQIRLLNRWSAIV